MTRRPILIQGEDLASAAQSPSEVPPVPDLRPAPVMERTLRQAARKPSWFSRLTRWAIAGLLSMYISLTIWDFTFSMLERNIWLGRIAIGLSVILLLAVALVILKELAAISRFSRIDKLQNLSKNAHSSGNRDKALHASNALIKLYANRDALRIPTETLLQQRDALLDADAILDLTERHLLTTLDAEARRRIEAASRTVAGATALLPMALLDISVALSTNIRMIRQIAEVYSGRAGALGSLRLLKAVATHLVATGALSVGDDLIGSVASGGALSKISRRFGEGVINGALTARVGIAAMEVCRPMPFTVLPRPRITTLIKRALADLFSRAGEA